jgi:hypothetical protein
MLFRRKERIIARLLDEPLTRIVMRADGVDPQALARDLERIHLQPVVAAARAQRNGAAPLRTSFAAQAKGTSSPCGACSS